MSVNNLVLTLSAICWSRSVGSISHDSLVFLRMTQVHDSISARPKISPIYYSVFWLKRMCLYFMDVKLSLGVHPGYLRFWRISNNDIPRKGFHDLILFGAEICWDYITPGVKLHGSWYLFLLKVNGNSVALSIYVFTSIELFQVQE